MCRRWRGCSRIDERGRCRRRRRAHRRAQRPVERLCRQHGRGVCALGPDGGGGFRRQGGGDAGRGRRRGPSQQARCRRRDRAALVRPGEGRRHRRSRQLRGRPRGQRDRPREEQGDPRFRRRHHRAHRQELLAQYGAMDLRHLVAIERHRHRLGEGLSLIHI